MSFDNCGFNNFGNEQSAVPNSLKRKNTQKNQTGAPKRSEGVGIEYRQNVFTPVTNAIAQHNAYPIPAIASRYGAAAMIIPTNMK